MGVGHHGMAPAGTMGWHYQALVILVDVGCPLTDVDIAIAPPDCMAPENNQENK